MRTATLPALLLALLATVPAGQADDGEKPDRGKKTPAQMVDALANRNKPPKLVKVYVDRLPLFPRDYDWDEERRVRAALANVYKDTSEELWEELVRKSDDPRYCLIDMDEGDWGWNRPVGMLCGWRARDCLGGVVWRHLPTEGNGLPHTTRIVASVDVKIGPGLREWREKRKGKVLYQLQLELCEQALGKLRKSQDVPEDKKEAAQRAIESEAAKLRETKRPILLKHDGPILDVCTREYAEQCRKTIEGKE
jgi:hypothetical protein